jgi:hypothetical protein
MTRTSSALGLIVLLAGCAMTYKAVQVGPNTWQTSAVAAPARGGIAGAQEHAMQAANDKCASLGKQINVTNVDTGHEFPAAGRAVVTFECK